MTERHARADRERGRNANLAGKPFDLRQNIDWQRGWQDAQQVRALDDDDWCGEHSLQEQDR